MERRPRVLLATATAGGTIAAVRLLAANGYAAHVLSSRWLGAAAWSRHAAKSYSAPKESQPQQFLKRVLKIGAADPGMILLPTSDETAWIYAENSEQLGKYFHLYQPPVACLERLLDKKLFCDAARAAGVPVLPSWDPRNPAELKALAPTLPYPILIKPRTHVHRKRNDKGAVVQSADELIAEYAQFIAREQHRTAECALLPEAGRPILQQFVDVTIQGVHSVSGFIDRTGAHFVTRRSKKILQRSQPVGVGICFESLPPAAAVTDAVRRLCRELGYFGIFEVEFIWFDGQWCVIDFNPRLFHQIGMDIYSGLPSPLLACLDARGETAKLQEAVARAQAEDAAPPFVFYDSFTLHAILLAKKLSGLTTLHEIAHWRAWTEKNAKQSVDVVSDLTDRLPSVIHAISELRLGLMALPKFLKSTAKVQEVMSGTLKRRSS